MRIAIIGSLSRDTVEVEGRDPIVRHGGPACFLSNALDRLGVTHDTYTGATPVEVCIAVRGGREVGAVASCPPIIVPNHVVADACIVSTILDDFSVTHIPKLPGYHALDVQGYVRQAGGGRHAWAPPEDVWSALACVKATERELTFLPETFVASQRMRTLIVTRGPDGATIWDHGMAHEISTIPVVVQDALGAGDTFLAAFVVATLRGMAVPDAGRFAARVVHDMLSERAALFHGGNV